LFVSAGLNDLNIPPSTATERHFDDTFTLNVRGTFFTAQKALTLLRDGGSIVLNTSITNVMGLAGASVYSASKAAVRSFARTRTNELKDRKIRVNAVSPGPIGDTGTFENVPSEIKSFLATSYLINTFKRLTS
jgi:NAD(P)-dependent dehydrogenase (short-subunit alcohol dehydrogenase family)